MCSRATPSSRREPLDDPIVGVPKAIAEAVVHAVGAPLPEFEKRGNGAIAAPVRRAGNGTVGVRRGELLEALVEIAAAGQDLALLRGPRAELRAARPRGPVVVGLLLGDAADRPLDAHLALQRRPPEHQRRARVLVA